MNWPYIHGLETSLAEEIRIATEWARSKGLSHEYRTYIGQTREYFWFGNEENGETIKVRKSKERRKYHER